jgi:ABC-type thiamine transport system ATPase subunit
MAYKKYSLPLTDDSIDTRGKRRRMVRLIRVAIDKIHFAEGMYMTRIPKNLQGGNAYDAALTSMDLLEDAILALDEAYYD